MIRETTNTPYLLIVGGVHGAGKTTLCREVVASTNWPHITPEEVKKTLPADTPREKIIKQLRNEVESLLDFKQSFCFEHVMSGNYVGKLINKAKECGYFIHLVYLDIGSIETANSRIDQRVREGGHEPDRSQLTKRLEQSRRNFFENYLGLADAWDLFRNDGKERELVDSSG